MATSVFSGPGYRQGRTITSINIHTNPQNARWAPSFIFFDGNLTRDPDNNPKSSIRCGLILGKVTATNLYANSIMGLTTASYTSGGTSLTVSGQCAIELNRRVGASGTFKLVGGATAGATAVVATVTYSAINTTTGVITVTNIGANVIVGSLVMPTDGSGVPVTVYDGQQGYPVDVLDTDQASINAPVGRLLIGGDLASARIINLTACDAGAQTWLKGQLQANGRPFTFDNDR